LRAKGCASNVADTRLGGIMLKRKSGRIASATAMAAGSFGAFAIAAGTVVAWAVTGPMFDFNDT